MPDPLSPPLNSFVITADEESAINSALSTTKPWKHDSAELKGVSDTLAKLKNRIRDFHLLRQSSKCCYCRMNLHGGGDFIIDREHIVPKEQFKILTYVISNLSVACKRCNMQLKKKDISFLIDPASILTKHAQADQYLFIHPNFERYSSFIKKISYEVDDSTYVKYTKSDHAKSIFTYNYFELRELEVNTFDQAQGISVSDETTTIKERLAQEIATMV